MFCYSKLKRNRRHSDKKGLGRDVKMTLLANLTKVKEKRLRGFFPSASDSWIIIGFMKRCDFFHNAIVGLENLSVPA